MNTEDYFSNSVFVTAMGKISVLYFTYSQLSSK